MVCHTSALSYTATVSSKQAHHHTSRHYSPIWCAWSKPPTMQARRFASVSTLAGATRGRVLFYSQVLGPRLWWRALCQGLAMCCTNGPVISSELTPFYKLRAHTALRPVNSHHSTSCSCSVPPVHALVLSREYRNSLRCVYCCCFSVHALVSCD